MRAYVCTTKRINIILSVNASFDACLGMHYLSDQHQLIASKDNKKVQNVGTCNFKLTKRYLIKKL